MSFCQCGCDDISKYDPNIECKCRCVNEIGHICGFTNNCDCRCNCIKCNFDEDEIKEYEEKKKKIEEEK